MNGIIDKRLKGLVGVTLMVLMGLELYMSRERRKWL